MEEKLLNTKEPYKAGLTREKFLFHEMRIVAKLLLEGKTDEEIVKEVYDDNLFQYPTEKMIVNLCKVCLKRIHRLDDDRLVEIIANGTSDSAKQVCLYAMIIQYRIIYEFMVGVIGDKYKTRDFSFSRKDVNEFFTRLQEQSDVVASWKESTVKRIKSLIVQILVENKYLDNNKAQNLNTVLIDLDLKEILLEKRQYDILKAFNCFEEE